MYEEALEPTELCNIRPAVWAFQKLGLLFVSRWSPVAVQSVISTTHDLSLLAQHAQSAPQGQHAQQGHRRVVMHSTFNWPTSE